MLECYYVLTGMVAIVKENCCRPCSESQLVCPIWVTIFTSEDEGVKVNRNRRGTWSMPGGVGGQRREPLPTRLARRINEGFSGAAHRYIKSLINREPLIEQVGFPFFC